MLINAQQVRQLWVSFRTYMSPYIWRYAITIASACCLHFFCMYVYKPVRHRWFRNVKLIVGRWAAHSVDNCFVHSLQKLTQKTESGYKKKTPQILRQLRPVRFTLFHFFFFTIFFTIRYWPSDHTTTPPHDTINLNSTAASCVSWRYHIIWWRFLKSAIWLELMSGLLWFTQGRDWELRAVPEVQLWLSCTSLVLNSAVVHCTKTETRFLIH